MAKTSPKARKRAKRPSATPSQAQKVAPTPDQSTPDDSLTQKQALFVREYLKDWNATRAAIRAGYSARTANRIGARLLTNVVISTAVEAAKAKALEEVEMEVEDILREYSALASSDITEFLDERGSLLPASEWPKRARRAVASVKVTKKNLTVGDGEMDDVVEIKLWNKNQALDSLSKIRGLMIDRKEVGKPGEFDSMTMEQIDAELEKLRAKHAKPSRMR